MADRVEIPISGQSFRPFKSQSTFPLTDMKPSRSSKHTETTQTLSGATLASRKQSYSDGQENTSPRRHVDSVADLAGLESSWDLKPTPEVHLGSDTSGLRSKLFQTLHNQHDLFLREDNFSPETDVDVLCVSPTGGRYLQSQTTEQVQALVDDYSADRSGGHKLLALFVKLEKSPSATFHQRASLSRPLTESLFRAFDIHNSFLGDLVGRPDYWTAVGRSQDEDGRHVEFFCQHPRWAQTRRYDKEKHQGGHRAPCSVYMHHSKTSKLTLYIVTASPDEDWFPSLRERIGIVEDQEDVEFEGTMKALASSPFTIHAVVSTIAFEQSIQYVADVRDRLMAQIRQVNDYSDETASDAPRKTMKDRIMLENITKQLHLVSQTADSGIASAHMSIKLAERMLESHSTFMMGENLPLSDRQSATFVRDTHHALEYVRNSFYCQRDWLTTYKARKDTAMNFVFNVVTQQDSATNVDISYKMSRDSSSMNAVTILTLIFLPGTFISTVFSSTAFQTDDSGAARTTDFLAPFLILGVALTVFCWCMWYFRKRIGLWRRRVFSRASRIFSKAETKDASLLV